MKDDKILKRIRNLLAMAADANSPNEAAIAAKRARSLMDKYQVEECDVPEKETVVFDVNIIEVGKRIRKWKGHMAIAVAKYCDVISRKRRDYETGGMIREFVGIDSDVAFATQMYRYLENTAEKLAKAQAKNKNSFKVGFSFAISDRLEELIVERDVVTSGGTDLIVVKNALVVEEFGAPNYVSKTITISNREDEERGYQFGKSVALGNEIKGNKQETLRLQ